MSESTIVLQIILGIASGMLFFLAAAGVSLVLSGMNILNFGQGAFFVLGSFLCLTLTHVLNFWWALLIAPLIVAALGFLTELLLRPLYGKNILYQLILTMGIGLVIIAAMVFIWGSTPNMVLMPAPFNTSIQFLNSYFPTYYFFIIAISGLIALGLWFMFDKTKLGMTFRAIISDRPMVANLGINVSLLFSVMFMFGVWLSGIGGVLMAPIIGITAENSMTTLFTVIVVLVIGGLNSMRAAFFAALIVGVILSLGSLFLPMYYTLIPSALMILVLLIKPSGLFVKD